MHACFVIPYSVSSLVSCVIRFITSIIGVIYVCICKLDCSVLPLPLERSKDFPLRYSYSKDFPLPLSYCTLMIFLQTVKFCIEH